ncbi:MAG: aminotransferase class V-fold PLP-dependent enzyme [Sphingomonas bacterium]|uniref:aminotransferase class V-fold PLP-dependent enzyme n=1 Tax=Sphingomonas bacterium TaxID=1895847 RepID=UPI00261BAD3A|nr:aminotransferase class V-fold PLP-dependent enzyme [Sphingomonas bacterium]MDB5711599.1 aminotransferase class V-fold PLP-dependent enzyme [Sphingomonas bacterium]
MLARLESVADTFDFDALRAAEFARLDAQNIAYLDYTASALYGASQALGHADRLACGIFGNPHSEHVASRNSGAAMDAARAATLAFFDADPALYDVCFTANTTAAIKLVAESYRFGPRCGLILAADNHNSVNGAREYARRAGAPVAVLPLDEELRLDQAADRLCGIITAQGPGLLAFPSQSNFSGVRHDLALVDEAQGLGCDVMIDAASGGACGGLSLTRHAAEFVACSFYKLFGLPTGVGALVVKKAALARLDRPWFSGGTVAFVSVAQQRHALLPGHEGFEDGTPNFLDLAAVESGFAFLDRIPRAALRTRIAALTDYFLRRAANLKHVDGSPLVRLYGPQCFEERGGTVAFNLLWRDGVAVPYRHVELRARDHGVALRGGCFCNPGAAEKAFGFDRLDTARCLEMLEGGFGVAAFHACLGADATVGALRLSVGAPTSFADIDRALALIASYAV